MARLRMVERAGVPTLATACLCLALVAYQIAFEMPPPHYEEGRIAIKIGRGVEIRDLVIDLGDDPADAEQTASPPFTPEDLFVGIDRHWIIHVEPGTESRSLERYRRDRRVEHAQLIGAGPVSLFSG